jgi:hypothetical protein
MSTETPARRPRTRIGAGIGVGVGVGTALAVALDEPFVIAVGLVIGVTLGAVWQRLEQ